MRPRPRCEYARPLVWWIVSGRWQAFNNSKASRMKKCRIYSFELPNQGQTTVVFCNGGASKQRFADHVSTAFQFVVLQGRIAAVGRHQFQAVHCARVQRGGYHARRRPTCARFVRPSPLHRGRRRRWCRGPSRPRWRFGTGGLHGWDGGRRRRRNHRHRRLGTARSALRPSCRTRSAATINKDSRVLVFMMVFQ